MATTRSTDDASTVTASVCASSPMTSRRRAATSASGDAAEALLLRPARRRDPTWHHKGRSALGMSSDDDSEHRRLHRAASSSARPRDARVDAVGSRTYSTPSATSDVVRATTTGNGGAGAGLGVAAEGCEPAGGGVVGGALMGSVSGCSEFSSCAMIATLSWEVGKNRSMWLDTTFTACCRTSRSRSATIAITGRLA